MVSNSIDVNPIKNYRGNNSVIVSRGDKSRDISLIKTPRPVNIQPKPVLGVELKLLVSNAPAP